MSRVVTPLEGRRFAGWDESAPIAAPLALHACAVKPEWTDYNEHMSESCYLLVFGDNSDAFFRFFGVDEDYRAAGFSLYTIDTRIRYLREVEAGAEIAFTLQLLDVDAKRLHIFHRMRRLDSGEELATCEQILVHVDMKNGRSSPLPADLAARLEAIRAAHASLPLPETVGAPLGLKRNMR